MQNSLLFLLGICFLGSKADLRLGTLFVMFLFDGGPVFPILWRAMLLGKWVS